MITIKNKPLLADALMFDHAYHVLKGVMDSGIHTGNLKDISLAVPIAVNCAFACELFFKSMLPDNIKDHKLENLYNSLDELSRNAIVDAVTKLMQRDVPNYSDIDFRSDLANNSEAFVMWRYFYESRRDKPVPSFEARFMYNLEEALKSLALFYNNTTANESNISNVHERVCQEDQ